MFKDYFNFEQQPVNDIWEYYDASKEQKAPLAPVEEKLVYEKVVADLTRIIDELKIN